MPVFSDPSDPTNTPMSSREEKRLIRLRIWVWGKQFAARLKANALRMKQFLHAGS